MMLLLLLIIPIVGAILAFVVPQRRIRRIVLVASALVHTLLTSSFWINRPEAGLGKWLQLDEIGLLFLSITSVLFLAAAFYAVGYLRLETGSDVQKIEDGMLFTNAPEAVFTGCLLLFLATMSLVIVSQHFGLLWVAVEATTLASAPLIYYHRHDRSLEATWKYLLLCSVGIAVALLGTFFLALSATGIENHPVTLLVGNLVARGEEMNIPWLKAAFLFFIVGYGTKMGLAPMHSWLPDAHSESPSVVSALLSGALLNCAFLGIMRLYQVCIAAGQKIYCQDIFIVFGILSMIIAAAFIIKQQDFKRLLAYSSVEHMGIMILGIGLGGIGIYGTLFHALNHALTKGMLFLVAGIILTAYKTKKVTQISGMWNTIPLSGVLWTAGFLSITGSPPFGMFWSELIILKAALEKGQWGIASLYLFLLAVIFIAMGKIVLAMLQGQKPDAGVTVGFKEKTIMVLPPALLGVAVLVLGLYLPPFLKQVLQQAAFLLGG